MLFEMLSLSCCKVLSDTAHMGMVRGGARWVRAPGCYTVPHVSPSARVSQHARHSGIDRQARQLCSSTTGDEDGQRAGAEACTAQNTTDCVCLRDITAASASAKWVRSNHFLDLDSRCEWEERFVFLLESKQILVWLTHNLTSMSSSSPWSFLLVSGRVAHRVAWL